MEQAHQEITPQTNTRYFYSAQAITTISFLLTTVWVKPLSLEAARVIVLGVINTIVAMIYHKEVASGGGDRGGKRVSSVSA